MELKIHFNNGEVLSIQYKYYGNESGKIIISESNFNDLKKWTEELDKPIYKIKSNKQECIMYRSSITYCEIIYI